MLTLTVKVPRETFDVKSLREGLLSAMRNSADEAQDLFKSSVYHFDDKPQVRKRITKSKKANFARIWIRDPRYYRISKGTKKHKVGVGGRLMRFRGYNLATNKTVKIGLGANKHIYKPKTQPGRIASTPGFPMVGTQWVVARGPWPVSGIEPRKFDEQILAAVKPGFIAGTQAAVGKFVEGK